MLVALHLAAGLALAAPDAASTPAAEVGSARAAGRVASFRALRDRAVEKQAYDFSCGAAAFATLLRHGLGEEVTEAEILRRLFRDASEAEERLIRNRGVSILDMQRLAQERGLRAQGFRLSLAQLARIRRPVIVFIRPLGYEHFAVLKGIRGGRALLADPSLGNTSLPLHRFREVWQDASGQGVVFVAERRDGTWPEASPLALGGNVWPAAAPLTGRTLEVGRPGHSTDLPGYSR